MFYYIHGRLEYNDGFTAVIDCGGVGFECFVSTNTAKKTGKAGETVRLYTHFNVREDNMELYGFADQEELRCFRMLISVSGIGCKVALSILSVLTPSKFALAIATGDIKAFTTAPGVGNKLAQRILLELKDKIKKDMQALGGLSDDNAGTVLSDTASEAVDALIVLGYRQNEAAAAVAKCPSGTPLEGMIRQALKELISIK